jgi:cytochrome c biogenesis protein CcmG/thiol:disulfide interchange protein DsbE
MKTGLIFLGVAIFILFMVVLALQPSNIPVVGDPAPDFSVSTFGQGEWSLANHRGEVVALNFWASWCTSCREEAVDLERVWQDYEDKEVAFIGVTVKDNPAKSLEYNEEFNVTYPCAPDPQEKISKSYGVTGVPETFLIARDGRLARKFIGPVSEATLKSALDGLLQ